MGRLGRPEHARRLEFHGASVQVAKEAEAPTEEERSDVHLELVHEASGKQLLHDARSAGHGHVPLPGRRAGLGECRFDAVGDAPRLR